MKTAPLPGNEAVDPTQRAGRTTELDEATSLPADETTRPDDSSDTTRDRVMHSILEHGPSTATELAERLDLTPAAIRRHLSALLDAGALRSQEQRVYGHRGRGRPSKVFVITETGRRDFYQAYDSLAIQAIRELAKVAGPAALRELAEQRVADIERSYREQRAADPEQSPVTALAKALTDAGYVASIVPVASGDQLCQYHCPVSQVAEEFPQLCEAETQLFSRLLDSHVQRLATIAHGDGVCTTHIPRSVVLGLPERR